MAIDPSRWWPPRGNDQKKKPGDTTIQRPPQQTPSVIYSNPNAQPPPVRPGDLSQPGFVPSVGGGLNPAGAPQPPGTSTPAAATVPNAGYGAVGTPQWNQYTLNDLLRGSGFDNWQIVGTEPVQLTTTVKNDLFDPTKPISAENQQSYVVPGNAYIVNIRNPQTNEVKELRLSKVWETGEGQRTTADPNDPTQGYGWTLAGPNAIADLVKPDPKNVGHSNHKTIGGVIWGQNNATGVFEPVPGAPPVPDDAQKWGSLQQVQEPDGSLAWYGVDPADGQPKRVQSMPVIPKEAAAWGNATQIDDGSGNKVWYGTNPTTKALEPIPNMPVVKAEPPGPGSITQGGTTYVKQPNGGYAPASGIPDPNPPVGTPRNVLDANGFIVQEKYAGGGRWDFDPSFETVPYTDAAKAARGATGAMHKAGEKGEKVINGMVYTVTYRGGGDDNYDFDTTVAARRYPGMPVEKPLTATSAEQEFITRYNPETGQQENVKNPNWSPEATGDRTRQLRELAAAKQQELSGRIGQNGYTAEQAQRDFDTYWDTQIEPRRQQLQFEQEQERRKVEREAETARQTALTTAQNVGQNAVANYESMQKNMVGPGFAQNARDMQAAIAEGRTPTINPEAYQYQGPDLNQLAQYHTARALQHISPTAAGLLGGQPTLPQAVQGMDMNSLLNRTAFQPQGQPQGGVTINVNAGGATTTTPAQTAADPAAAARAALAAQPFNAFGPTAIDDPYGRTNALV